MVADCDAFLDDLQGRQPCAKRAYELGTGGKSLTVSVNAKRSHATLKPNAVLVNDGAIF